LQHVRPDPHPALKSLSAVFQMYPEPILRRCSSFSDVLIETSQTTPKVRSAGNARCNPRSETDRRMRSPSWTVHAATAAILISAAGCSQVQKQQTAAELVASGDPQACGASETQQALRTALNIQPTDVVAITFSATEPKTRKVRCRVDVKTGSVEFEVAENLATPGRVTVRAVEQTPSIAIANTALGSASTNESPEPQIQLASPRGHTFNIPDYYPEGYKLWRAATAHIPVSERPWVRSLQGTASDVRQVNIAAEQYLIGWVCEPHNCGGNEAVVLISRDQKRSFGYVRLTNDQGTVTDFVAGTATGRESACAKFFLEDRSDASTCNG